MNNMYDAIQGYVDDAFLDGIVESYGESEELTMRVGGVNVSEDGAIYADVDVHTSINVGYEGVDKSNKWSEFVSDLIPVKDLNDRAEEVSEDLNENLDEMFYDFASEIEDRVQESFNDWFLKEYDEVSEESVRVSVGVNSAVEQFPAEYLIEERKLQRDNS